jgi:hypothetical protein
MRLGCSRNQFLNAGFLQIIVSGRPPAMLPSGGSPGWLLTCTGSGHVGQRYAACRPCLSFHGTAHKASYLPGHEQRSADRRVAPG